MKKLLPLLAVLLLSGCNAQRTMLYHPSSHMPSPAELAADRIQFWPSGGSAYRGFIGTAPTGAVKGTIVVFHGNAGNAADRAYYVNPLSVLGYRVVLAEYPGYGARAGKPGEASFVRDARETVRLAYERYGKPVYLLGESLGCGVAAAVAGDAPSLIDGILLITPWDTLLSVAQEKFPWFPVRLFLSDAYDSVGNLKAFLGRIAVVGAENDRVIPIHHARALYDALPGPKRMWTIKGAGHNDWLDAIDLVWWREIIGFAAGSKGPKASGDTDSMTGT